jgi:N-acetylneuraminic acid mutarotase
MDSANAARLLKPVKWQGALLAGLVFFVALNAVGQENPVPPSLPVPVSNNAVAEITVDNVQYVMSFMGIGPGKTYQDISRQAWLWTSESGEWIKFPDVPVDRGRLASVAVGMQDHILLFGGYTVSKDGTEVSTPEVFMIDPREQTYERLADMPVPVDDTVALPYAGRYVFLVSGWHDVGNVGEVQRYDTLEDSWTAATAFPGVTVFGHAGGIVGNTLIVVGGVGVIAETDGQREFGAIDQAYKGTINPANPDEIEWQALPPTLGTNRYRMAATGDARDNRVFFAGGTERPYNYSGIGYDGEPAEPTGAAFAFDLKEDRWIHFDQLDRPPSMDHRGLLRLPDGALITIGGMGTNQQVLDSITVVEIPSR